MCERRARSEKTRMEWRTNSLMFKFIQLRDVSACKWSNYIDNEKREEKWAKATKRLNVEWIYLSSRIIYATEWYYVRYHKQPCTTYSKCYVTAITVRRKSFSKLLMMAGRCFFAHNFVFDGVGVVIAAIDVSADRHSRWFSCSIEISEFKATHSHTQTHPVGVGIPPTTINRKP